MYTWFLRFPTICRPHPTCLNVLMFSWGGIHGNQHNPAVQLPYVHNLARAGSLLLLSSNELCGGVRNTAYGYDYVRIGPRGWHGGARFPILPLFVHRHSIEVIPRIVGSHLNPDRIPVPVHVDLNAHAGRQAGPTGGRETQLVPSSPSGAAPTKTGLLFSTITRNDRA